MRPLVCVECGCDEDVHVTDVGPCMECVCEGFASPADPRPSRAGLLRSEAAWWACVTGLGSLMVAFIVFGLSIWLYVAVLVPAVLVQDRFGARQLRVPTTSESLGLRRRRRRSGPRRR